MTVLVTGGAGFIGSHMAWGLVDAGRKVVVVDDLSTGDPAVVPPQARLVVGDVANRDLLTATIREYGVTAIAHFAGNVILADSVVDPLGFYRNNTLKTQVLIEAAVAAGVKRIIFSSTASVYGEPTTFPIREDFPLEPITPYGRSKLMAEWILRDAGAAYGLDFVILRYFNVAGADPHGRSGQSSPVATHLIKVACQAAIGQREKVYVHGLDYPTPDGTCQRDYIQVSDLVDAHLAGLVHLEAGGESLVLNCGRGRGVSVLEIVSEVKAASGVDFPVEITARRAGDPAILIASNEALRRRLGWAPRHEVSDMVRQALAWERHLRPASP